MAVCELLESCNDLMKSVDEVKQAIESDNLLDNELGNSLLGMRNGQLVSYITNLIAVSLRKCNGQSIQSNIAIEHLVEIRTVLEKVRPLTRKLQSQFDRLLRNFSDQATTSVDDNLTPAMENLVEESEFEDDDGQVKKYAPPKISAMHYDTGNTREKKSEDRMRLDFRDKRLLEELKLENSRAPIEINDKSITQSIRQLASARKKEEYEENHMIRLRMSSKQKMAQRKEKDTAFLDNILAARSMDFDKNNFNAAKNPKSPVAKGKRKGKSKGAKAPKTKKQRRK